MSRRPIALLTDFGLSDPYVGAIKAVILGINPEAAIFDVTHHVEPQAIEQGAFLLGSVVPFLPPASICIAVVDPGVGTEREAIALQTPLGTFVGPDNGILSAALPEEQRPRERPAGVAWPVPVPSDCRACRLANQSYFRLPVSNTFHGRDIFAPVGAHISAGVPLAALGPPVESILAFPPWRAPVDASGALAGRVIHIDRFGNLISDVRIADLPDGSVQVEINGRQIRGPQRSYQEGPDFVVYAGSSGFLEIARRNANAAAALNVRAGDRLRVRSVG